MTEGNTSLDDKLAAVRRLFVGKLGAKIGEIEVARLRLFEAESEDDAPPALEALIFPVHRLAGSAGSFGFPAVSESASVLEKLLHDIAEDKRLPNDKERWQILALMERLRQSAAKPEAPASSGIDIGRAEQDQPKDGENQTVFLLEDDEELASDLTSQLEHHGYQARVFHNASDLRRAAEKTPPAALILDIILPDGELAGIEALDDILRACSSPAIVLSRRDDLVSRLQAVRAGAHGYFSKPLDITRIVEALDKMTAAKENDPYRILIVDDDRALAEFYKLLLEKAGMIVEIVTHPLRVMEPLFEFRPDLILMDINMPDCNGIELASVIRQKEDFFRIPIVFLTSESTYGRRLLALQSGGDDFLAKPVRTDLLISSLISRAERARQFDSLISRDGMTGLVNHSKIKELLETEVYRGQRENQPLAFAMIDIDLFKSVNDSHGHWAGDTVIKVLARALGQRLRKTDIIGRYGGEEFAVILPNTEGADAGRLMNRIRAAFGQIRHIAKNDEFYVTFSCGVATFPAIATPELLTTTADDALYAAKNQGRDRVILAGSQADFAEMSRKPAAAARA